MNALQKINNRPDSFYFQKKDAREDTEYLKSRFNEIKQSTQDIQEDVKKYLNYCTAEKLHIDKSAVLASKKTISNVFKVLDSMKDINLDPLLPVVDYSKLVTELLQKYRALLHAVLSASLILDWRSPSYNQSIDAMFFTLNCQNNTEINYNRYRSARLSNLENHLTNIFSLDTTQNKLLMTSSGMAAYNLIESYLIRYVLKSNDIVLIPHYIYFETYEQISRLPMVKIERSNTYDATKIYELILNKKPRVVFLDPVTNTSELRMVNIEKIIEQLETQIFEDDIYLVIDGSMISGELLPFSKLKNEKIKILYYDSCSKYLQLGLDISMGGLVVIPAPISKIISRLRTNTGTIMYDNSVSSFPIYSLKIYKQRMKRFTRNAILIGKTIEEEKMLSSVVQVNYPLLKSHPDYLLAKKYDSNGAILTFSFSDPLLNERNSLNKFINIALSLAKKQEISLVKGLSFGFSLPRIFASSARPENNNALPYLRLSVGDRSYCETKLLANILLEAFKIHTNHTKSRSQIKNKIHGIKNTKI